MSSTNETSQHEAIIAEVVFDSAAQTAGIGFRGASEPRHVVLRALNVDIHVRLSETGGHSTLMGQVLTRYEFGGEAAVVHLLANGKRITSVTPNHLGEFRFRDVPNEGLSLQVDLSSLTLIGSLRTQVNH